MREFYYMIFNFIKSIGNGCDSSNHSLTMFVIIAMLGIIAIIIGGIIEEIDTRRGAKK